MTDKATLRREGLRRREQIVLSPDAAERAAVFFMETIRPTAEQIVSLYVPQGSEFDVMPLSLHLTKAAIVHALPVMQLDSRVLGFARWNIGQSLRVGKHNISEPSGHEWLEPDIIIVPLLAFDRRGHRLGYGGGYYDATLSSLKRNKAVLAVGLCYAEQESTKVLPVEAHDQKLDWVITPEGARHFAEGIE